MRLPNWTWHWAWVAFLKWSLNPVLNDTPTAGERWNVVAWSLWPGIKHHYLRPADAWLQEHLPTTALLMRLQKYDADWYHVPSTSAAIHLWRRLGVHALEGDFVRIVNGEATTKGIIDDDLGQCEFWQVSK